MLVVPKAMTNNEAMKLLRSECSVAGLDRWEVRMRVVEVGTDLLN